MPVYDIIKLLIPVANIIDRKHERKYKEKVLQLQKDIYEEENKHEDIRDDRVLHDLNNSLMRLVTIFASELERQNAES